MLGVHAANDNLAIIKLKKSVLGFRGRTRTRLHRKNGISYLKDSIGIRHVLLKGKDGSILPEEFIANIRAKLQGKWGAVMTYKSSGRISCELSKGSAASGSSKSKHTHLVEKHSRTDKVTIN